MKHSLISKMAFERKHISCSERREPKDGHDGWYFYHDKDTGQEPSILDVPESWIKISTRDLLKINPELKHILNDPPGTVWGGAVEEPVLTVEELRKKEAERFVEGLHYINI